MNHHRRFEHARIVRKAQTEFDRELKIELNRRALMSPILSVEHFNVDFWPVKRPVAGVVPPGTWTLKIVQSLSELFLREIPQLDSLGGVQAGRFGRSSRALETIGHAE